MAACLALALASPLAASSCGGKRSEPAPTDAAAAPPEAAAPAVEAAAEPAAEPDASAEPAPTAEHGAALYGRMCAVCHGADGEGYRADQATALAHPDFLASVSDAFLAFAIVHGRQGTTMSAWGKQRGGPLDDRDVASLILHLRSWQKTPSIPRDDALAGNPERGKATFTEKCERCHGRKAPYVRITNRQWLVHADPAFIRHAIVEGRRGTKMPAYGETLDASTIDDVIAYLRAQPHWMVPGEVPGSAPETPLPLGPVLNPKGPAPRGFRAFPAMTSVSVVGPELKRGAKMMLLDARVPSDYLALHIEGAVSVPFYDPAPYVDQLPRDTWLVCYCGCPHAESGQLARQLRELGFRKVTVLDEGLYVWQERGFPVTTAEPEPAPDAGS